MIDDCKPCTDCGIWQPLGCFPERTRRTRTGYPARYRLSVCWPCQRVRDAVRRTERARRAADRFHQDPWAPF